LPDCQRFVALLEQADDTDLKFLVCVDTPLAALLEHLSLIVMKEVECSYQ